jgi:hypothetical protein
MEEFPAAESTLPFMARGSVNSERVRLEPLISSAHEVTQALPTGELWEVAHLALYLASTDSTTSLAKSFTIDGGLEMNWGDGA